MAFYSNAVTVVLSALFGLVLVLVIRYYRQVKIISEHYMEAREIVSTIVLTLKRELERQGKQMGNIQNEIVQLRSGRASKQVIGQVEDMASEINRIKERITQVEGKKHPRLEEIEELKEALEQVVETQNQVKTQLKMLDERYRGLLPEMEAEQMTPIVSNMILSRLHPTELQILHILVTEGAKSATEIQQQIGKTREHAARLMKKLYDQRFVERKEDRRPYQYIASKKTKELVTKPTEERTPPEAANQ